MKSLGRIIVKYIEYCAYRKRLASKILKAYRIELRQYAAFCASRKDCFVKCAVDDFITGLHRHYKYKTIRRKIASLKIFFHHWEYMELLNENPFAKLDIRFWKAKLLPKTIPFHSIQMFLSALYAQKSATESDHQFRCCVRDSPSSSCCSPL